MNIHMLVNARVFCREPMQPAKGDVVLPTGSVRA